MQEQMNPRATPHDRAGEDPKKVLAREIAAGDDRRAVSGLVENLKNRSAQGDSIKLLYEIGELKPSLIADFRGEFIRLLESRNNRMVWGAMTALDAITLEDPGATYSELTRIVEVADIGSVITRDHAVGILIKLCSIEQYSSRAFPLLLDQLRRCPSNQLSMYAENAAPIVSEKNKAAFIEALSLRLDGLQKESQLSRVRRVIGKFS